MAIINVASASALAVAISSAQGGDVIVLAPGDYGKVSITNRAFSGPVTITSASGADMAHFERLVLTGVSNVTIKQIDIGGARVEGETVTYVAAIQSSANILFDGVHIHGNLDGDPTSDRSGLSIRSSSAVTIMNSEFQDLLRGAWLQRSDDVQLIGNSFHDIRMDGIANSAVTNVLIDGNRFTNFHRQLEDHSDAIQFWSTNETTASTDIIIRNNVMTQGTGTAMQGIFMRDETGTLPYERILIENNLLYESGYANGITVMGGKAITMRNNTAFSVAGDSYTTKIRLENITGATISRNVTDQFAEFGVNSGIIYDSNLILSLAQDYLSLISDIYDGSTATIDGLTLADYGYQFPVSSADTTTAVATDPVTTTTDTTLSAPAATDTTTTSSTDTTTTGTETDNTTTTTRSSPFRRGGSKKTASELEETAITSADTSTSTTPTSFTTEGLYTGSYSYSGTTTTTQSAPLSSASADSSLLGSAFRSSLELYHA